MVIPSAVRADLGGQGSLPAKFKSNQKRACHIGRPFYYLSTLGMVRLMEEPVVPVPPVETSFLDDGSVEIRVGDQFGWVTSAHLIETKAHQLQQAWIANHSSL